jgi:hypothetical protein
MDSFNQLKELVQKNPDVLKYLSQPDPRKQQKKPKVIPGQTIEIPSHDESVSPIPISMAQAKQLLKKPRKPRTLSDESKAKMLANLQKGREALKLKKEQMIQQAKKTIAGQVKPQATTKFVVKPPAPKLFALLQWLPVQLSPNSELEPQLWFSTNFPILFIFLKFEILFFVSGWVERSSSISLVFKLSSVHCCCCCY